jgi:hypothetical protein
MITASIIETDIFNALNQLRTNPQTYTSQIQSRIVDFNDNFFHASGVLVEARDLGRVLQIA